MVGQNRRKVDQRCHSSMQPSQRPQTSEERLTQRWINSEDAFVVDQKARGSVIRVLENRYKPADLLLAQGYHLNGQPSVEDISQYEELCTYIFPAAKDILQAMTNEELKEFTVELNEFKNGNTLNMNSAEAHSRKRSHSAVYWKLLQQAYHRELEQRASTSESFLPTRDERAVEAVASDIEEILRGKSGSELLNLEAKVESMLDSNDKVDTTFWERVLAEIKVLTTDSKLVDVVDKLNRERAKRCSPRVSLPIRPVGGIKRRLHTDRDPGDKRCRTSRKNSEKIAHEATSNAESEFDTESESDIEVTPTENLRLQELNLDELRKFNLKLDRTRIKPQYTVKVVTSYHWNKRSRALYTKENLPPKTVKGYHFNIHYPDLPKSSPTPSYTVLQERDGGKSRINGLANSMCILLFESPPPYQYLAFRIVNSPWDRGVNQRSSGYVSQFENGVLRLNFKFKKLIYQRR